MMLSVRRISVVVFLIASVVSSGCTPDGPKLYPFTGSVSVNGKPAGSALVFLHRQGKTDMAEPTPYATAEEDGTFKILWQPGRDGATPGDYSVTVVWPDMTKAPDGNGGRPDVLRGTYEKLATSTLKATVKAEPTTLPAFELKLSTVQAAKPVVKDRNNT